MVKEVTEGKGKAEKDAKEEGEKKAKGVLEGIRDMMSWKK
jgi:hypothetical protein